MQSLIQLAAEAVRQTQQAQAVVSHNLANASTTAFKADMYHAESQYLMGGVNAASATAVARDAGVDFAPGTATFTGRDLDIAISGEGWMKVLAPDGTEALSRRGDLRVDVNGQLTNAQGHGIFGEGGPIALPPFSQLSIGGDGTISIVPLGEPPTSLVVIDRIALVNPPVDQISKANNGMFVADNMADLQPDASVRLAVGSLESSNVNPITAMVEMIELARTFEQHVKTMKSAEELDTASASLMRLE